MTNQYRPKDIMGDELHVGDHVARGAVRGSSSYLEVRQVTKINNKGVFLDYSHVPVKTSRTSLLRINETAAAGEMLADNELLNPVQKVAIYERLLHSLHTHRAITMNQDAIVKLLDKISAWSFAHNCSNGEQSEEECSANIERLTRALVD